MKFISIITELENLGTEQNRKIYAKHGAPNNMFGLSLTNLRRLKKEIGKNHDLALKLWATKNCDAQLLATTIADPNQFNYIQAKEWIANTKYYLLADWLSAHLLFKTKFSQLLMEELIRSKDEWEGRIAWKLMELFALSKIPLPDAYFAPYVEYIRIHLQKAQNRTKETMNSALIAIGSRNENLSKLCLEVAEEIGTVEVDHGATACKTPCAVSSITRRRKKHFIKLQ